MTYSLSATTHSLSPMTHSLSAMTHTMLRLLRVAALLSLGAAGLLPAQAPELSAEAQSFIEQHFAQAKSAEASQEFDKAIEQYELILKRYPSAVPEIYQNLGLVYYLTRRYDDS